MKRFLSESWPGLLFPLFLVIAFLFLAINYQSRTVLINGHPTEISVPRWTAPQVWISNPDRWCGVIVYEEHGQLRCIGYLPGNRYCGQAHLYYPVPLRPEYRALYYSIFPRQPTNQPLKRDDRSTPGGNSRLLNIHTKFLNLKNS